VKDALRHQFPQVEVNGGNYPVAPVKVLVAQVVQTLQFGMLGVVLAGDFLFTIFLGYPANGPFHPYYESIREKKMMVGMGTWFLGNFVSQGLQTTGAFEIAFNGEIIYSKMSSASHQLPTLQHIVQAMQRVQPDLISGGGRNRVPPPPSASTSSRRSSSRQHRASVVPDEDDGVNHDVHDMAYDEDNSV